MLSLLGRRLDALLGHHLRLHLHCLEYLLHLLPLRGRDERQAGHLGPSFFAELGRRDFQHQAEHIAGVALHFFLLGTQAQAAPL